MYSLAVFGNWLYSDEKAFAQVQALPVFEKLKELAGQGYFEELIRKYLLDNTHGSVITLVPSTGLAARKEKALEEKLQAHLERLSQGEKEGLAQLSLIHSWFFMKKYDYLIVGAGLFGSVFAHEAVKCGKTCLVIDKRDHIGGNIYTEEIEGIQVHKYGAHIFHTSNKTAVSYTHLEAVKERYRFFSFGDAMFIDPE